MKELEAITALAKSNVDIEILWLYGSQARGNAGKNSDYDLAVAFKNYIQEPVERRLRPELLALDWKRKLDIDLSIVDINLVALPLAYTIVQDNTVLYCKNHFRKMVEEQRIMSKWEIDYCYHKKHYA